jgi:integrase
MPSVTDTRVTPRLVNSLTVCKIWSTLRPSRSNFHTTTVSPSRTYSGVNVLALQRMLGHTSAAMTLDTYSDLFDDDLDAVGVTLRSRYSRSNVGKVWTPNARETPQQTEQ